MAELTPEEVERTLREAARAAERLNVSELRNIADTAVQRIEEVWPVATGRSQEAWTAVADPGGAGVINPVDYASNVHDGLAFELVPRTLDDLEKAWADALNSQLVPILEG